ncbi:lateral flagellin LafA [Pseudomonas sp. sia0905]|uniref:lateral flagellin LafA n=1 Tax=Pseudomonas sp. sia0905 TaxID=2854783 RepID=UPI001C44CEE9|nr:lateral flagellin LafA [Pseudomonas sp. sia0905]MBV7564382.1 lateral flagellin LafA [Pseudomonas sp. sia0905]
MALSIHTNYASLVTQSNLNKTNGNLSTAQQRLGTGYRVNSAADDAAGLQIATRLNAQSRGMDVASRNTGDAISLLQTAEGAFTEITDITQRLKDLATQAANDTNSADDRTALQGEFDALVSEIANIYDNTTYAGEKLFNATGGKLTDSVQFQIGATADEKLEFDVSTKLGDMDTLIGTDLAALDLSSASGAASAITDLATALDDIGSLRADFGANINRLNHTANNLANMKDNTDVARGRIIDADFASESANMTKNSMLMQSGISMLRQSGQMPSMVMSLLG